MFTGLCVVAFLVVSGNKYCRGNTFLCFLGLKIFFKHGNSFFLFLGHINIFMGSLLSILPRRLELIFFGNTWEQVLKCFFGNI